MCQISKPTTTAGPSQLHAFADASNDAYEAVAYLLWPTQDVSGVRLMPAKARLAPSPTPLPGINHDSAARIDGSAHDVEAHKNDLRRI